MRTALAELEANTVARGDAPYGEVSIWRGAGTCIADRPDIDLATVEAMAPAIAHAATSVTAVAADELDAVAPAAPEVTRARHIIELADETLTGHDLRTGARIDPSRSAGTDIDPSR